MSIDEKFDTAATAMTAWLRDLPEWPTHPTNESGSVSSHFGPTILSEHDCVLHFARFLNAAGVSWEDTHLELSPGQWIYTAREGAGPPKRIDLAVIGRSRLMDARLPVPLGALPLDAVVEFALASNYWEFGSGSPQSSLRKIRDDVAKVAEYLRSGLAHRGYVVVVEETDHGFPGDIEAHAPARGVELRLLRQWVG